MLINGVVLMILGMGVVFLFLAVMVITMFIVAKIIPVLEKIAPESDEKVTKIVEKTVDSQDGQIAIAIALVKTRN